MSKNETIPVSRKTIEDVVSVLDVVLAVAEGDKKNE